MALERGLEGRDQLRKLVKRHAREIQELHRTGLQLGEPYTCHGSCLLSLYCDVRGASYQKESGINSVDSHGQSEVAFAFCRLLGFELLPRLKAIAKQKLYRLEAGNPDAFPNLQMILSRPINWELIRQQYDQMIKYATALRFGTAETEAILRRFTRNNVH